MTGSIIGNGLILIAILRCNGAELTVAKLKEHSADGLGSARSGGPEQADGIGYLGDVLNRVGHRAVLVILHQSVDLTVGNGSQGADTVPDGGARAGGDDMTVNVGVDALILLAGIFHTHRHIAALHFDGIADVDAAGNRAVGIFYRGGGQGQGTALLVPNHGEVAPELQEDIQGSTSGAAGGSLDLIPHSFVFFLGIVNADLIGGIIRGIFRSLLHGDDAVGGHLEGGIIRHANQKHLGGGLALFVLHPVQNQLVDTGLQGVFHQHIHGVLTLVDHDVGAGDHRGLLNTGSGLAHGIGLLLLHRPQVGHIRGGVLQQLEVLAGDVQGTGAFHIDGLGIGGVEGYLLTQDTGTQQIEALAAQQILLRELGAGIDLDLEVTVLAEAQRRDVEEQIQGSRIVRVDPGDCGSVLALGLACFGGIIAGVGVDIVHGLDQNRQIRQRIGGEVFHHHPNLNITVISALHLGVVGGALQSAAVLDLHGAGKLGEVDGYPLVSADGHIGVNAVIGADSGAFAFIDAAQIVIQGIGTVGGHVVAVIGGIEGGSGRIGREPENRIGKICPMTEGHLIGLLLRAVHHRVDGIADHGGSAVVGDRHQHTVIGIGAYHGFLLNQVIAAVFAVKLIEAVVLGAQGGVEHDSGLHICHIIGGGGHIIADVHLTVLGVRLIHEAQGLGNGQVLNAPGGDNGAALDFRLHCGGVNAKEAILPSKDVLFHRSVGTGDLEGGEGGIIAFRGVQQILAVVRFF